MRFSSAWDYGVFAGGFLERKDAKQKYDAIKDACGFYGVALNYIKEVP